MTQSSTKGRIRVNFAVKAEPGSEVYVAGTFNDWNPKKHKLFHADGIHSASILLSPGRYEYKFVVNDFWCVDPECTEWSPNNMGSLNSVVIVE